MAFAAESLPLTRSFESFDTEEDFEESESFSGCGCFGKLCPVIWPRRKRNTLLGSQPLDYLVEPLEGQLSGDVVKDAKLATGPSCIPKLKLGNCRRKRIGKFCYDARSYALNFDDGDASEEDTGVYYSFMSRYAAPPKTRDK